MIVNFPLLPIKIFTLRFDTSPANLTVLIARNEVHIKLPSKLKGQSILLPVFKVLLYLCNYFVV